jgi:hypothetical protein
MLLPRPTGNRVHACSIPLDEEDREAISNWDMNPENDQVLKERVSKFASTN